MKARILGCSGGIGGRHLRTTSILINHDVLIDAGTGVADLSLAELALIDHVFLTHTHLDHIATLPLMIDTVGEMRDKPLVVYCTEAIQQILKNHIFNWAVWPDFSEIPSVEAPFLQFRVIRVGQKIKIGDLTVTAMPAEHTVPAVGYHLDSGEGSLAFTGDTTVNDRFWPVVNKIAQPALSDHRDRLLQPRTSSLARRLQAPLCPDMLKEELHKLQRDCGDLHVTHLKPGQIELTMQRDSRTCHRRVQAAHAAEQPGVRVLT
jgi:ribonuclease BN (tRNA processing enzyme)